MFFCFLWEYPDDLPFPCTVPIVFLTITIWRYFLFCVLWAGGVSETGPPLFPPAFVLFVFPFLFCFADFSSPFFLPPPQYRPFFERVSSERLNPFSVFVFSVRFSLYFFYQRFSSPPFLVLYIPCCAVFMLGAVPLGVNFVLLFIFGSWFLYLSAFSTYCFLTPTAYPWYRPVLQFCDFFCLVLRAFLTLFHNSHFFLFQFSFSFPLLTLLVPDPPHSVHVFRFTCLPLARWQSPGPSGPLFFHPPPLSSRCTVWCWFLAFYSPQCPNSTKQWLFAFMRGVMSPPPRFCS